MRARSGLLPLLLLAATLAGCASSSKLPSPPPPPPQIQPQPFVGNVPPEGTYWKKHCDFRRILQQRLNLTLPPFEPCSEAAPSDHGRR